MTLRLTILRRAAEDAQQIFNHIKEHSIQGAVDWWRAFDAAAQRALDPRVQYVIAPENDLVAYELRQILFKSRHGRMYRFVFTIVDVELRILRVRGPGQPSLHADEIFPDS